MTKLILFDIDGTLLRSVGAGRAAIRRALFDQLGTAAPMDSIRFDGKTDPQIVRELLTCANHPDAESETVVAQVCKRYAELLKGELELRAGLVRLLDGVEELLGLLQGRDDAVVGLLTGNIKIGAALKLQAAGLDLGDFQVGAFGSDAAERTKLPAIAAQRAESVIGREPTGQDVVIIGDTPADVECGRGIGARAIGVATGRYAIEALEEAGAYASFKSFAKPEPVVEAIFA